MPRTVEQEFYALSEVAKMFGVSVPTVRRLMDKGAIKGVNLAASLPDATPIWRISRESVERLRAGK